MLAADWPGGEASDAGGDWEPVGLLGESGFLISAILVVAVMGRWGIRMATGAVCSCGKSWGGEIFPCNDIEFSDWIKRSKEKTMTLFQPLFY